MPRAVRAMVNPVQALAGLALILLLPGYFLVKTVFPRERLSRDLHAPLLLFLSVALSVVTTVLVGSVLAFWPRGAGERGLFQGAATGAPIIETALAGTTAALAIAAIARGAFPRVFRGVGRWRNPPPPGPAGPSRPTLGEAGLEKALRRRAAAFRARREGRDAKAAEKDADADAIERDAADRQFGRA